MAKNEDLYKSIYYLPLILLIFYFISFCWQEMVFKTIAL